MRRDRGMLKVIKSIKSFFKIASELDALYFIEAKFHKHPVYLIKLTL